MAPQPALPDGRSHAAGDGQMLLGLDALGQDGRASGFGLGQYRVDDPGDLGGGAVLDEAKIELDDGGADKRQKGQAARFGADVV